MGNSEILNLLGGDQVQIDLEANESIYIKSDAQLLIDNSLGMDSTQSTGQNEGGIQGLFRSFSGEDVFFKKISNTTNNTATLFVSSIFPGYIQEVSIESGQSMVFASHAILACTTNLNISNKSGELANLMGGSGLALTEIVCPDGVESGMVWIYSWSGGYSKNLQDPHNFKVNAGLFVGCPSKVFDQIMAVGKSGMGSSLKGSGLMLNFEKCVSEGEVYFQVANIPDIMFKIATQKYEPRMEYSFMVPAIAGAAAVAGGAAAAAEIGEESPAQEGEKSSAQEGEESPAQEGEKPSAEEGEKPSEQEGEKPSEQEGEQPPVQEGEESPQKSEELPSEDSSIIESSSPLPTVEEATERKTPSEWLSTSGTEPSSTMSTTDGLSSSPIQPPPRKQVGRGVTSHKLSSPFRKTIKNKK